ncbi:flagellin [Nocardioides perillae]|uniref:Flagellin n=1 Tax=Nocardioides perillae TaxID=1119534 RepID=A0A7Y9RUS6_9ACTN|nr:flagellin [Nocardioides perillae]NYG57021.1 flagellin [Nocardioides perillae]
MSLRINQNIDAFNSYRNLSVTQNQMSKSLEKLSSGFRINRAADDAAGLAISEGLRSQVGSLKMGVRNAQDGISVAQTAEGALTEVHSMLQRMNDLSVQHNNGTQNDDSKAALSGEFTQLQEEITRITTNANFNGVALFGGEALNFQVGSTSEDSIEVSATALAAVDTSGASIEDSQSVKDAITQISTQRAELGAVQNRFEHTIKSVNVAVENLSASESRIRDTDMASEMMNFTRSQILAQAGTAMLAQANQAPQGVLSLLR